MKRLMMILMGACMMLNLSAGAEIPVNVREHTQKVTSYLRQMPRAQREAALAEMRGLLFMENGSSAYSSKTGSDTVEVRQGRKVIGKTKVPFRQVHQGAKFIGTDGKLYDFYAAQRSDRGRETDAWKQAKLHIYRAGVDAAFTSFGGELRELEVQRGRYFLRQMSPELRAALFAEVLGLLYLEGGGNAYTGKTCYSTIGGERVPYPEYRSGAKFVDAQGNVHGIAEVRAEANEQGKAWRTWWPGVKLNMHRAGQDAILAPFRAEIKAMREQSKK
ncbi:MAG: hypothetical protein ACI4OS_04045 [Akkermansia sp.]